jgi:hypothetical protein
MEKVQDKTVVLEDGTDEQKEAKFSNLLLHVRSDYNTARDARITHEDRWLKAYKQYKGVYDADAKFTTTEKSKVFIKLTKTKVMAAYGQIIDLLYSGGNLPISIDPTVLPEGIEESVHVDIEDPRGENPTDMGIGYPGDGNDLAPGEGLLSRIGSYLSKKLGNDVKPKPGPGILPTHVTYHPAKIQAKKMEKKIHDQLEESNANIHIRKAILEMVMLGTGCIKGPMSQTKEYPKWTEDGTYEPLMKDMPLLSYVSIWNIYPDPEATCLADCAYLVERHTMTKTQMRDLKKRPFFRAEAIEAAIADGPNAEKLSWESSINPSQGIETLRYEVLEYWGVVDAEVFKQEYNMPIPPELNDEVEFQVNVWTCGNWLLRVVLNPFTPRRMPYCVFPYELDPYSVFGVGMSENMTDSQMLMNGFVRMAVDNAAMSGNLVLEMDESLLVAGQSKALYPGKVFLRQGGQIGQSIHPIEFPNVTNELMMMYDRARQMADESTGLPSISHGQTGVYGGPGRTASGMSMFMGAASTAIKSVIKNLDDFLLQPLGEGFFAWNMQFDFQSGCSGDLEVSARGTAAFMQKEMKTQKLMQFMQIAAGNPATMPLVKFTTLLQEIAESLEIDPEKILNNPEEAALFANLMGQMGMGGPNAAGTPPGMPGPEEMGGGVPGPMGATPPAQPGQEGFTGQPQPQGQPLPGTAPQG